MSSARDRAALVALLQLGRRPWGEYAESVERAGSALSVLEEELAVGQGQVSLLPEDPVPLLSRAEEQVGAWTRDGLSSW